MSAGKNKIVDFIVQSADDLESSADLNKVKNSYHFGNYFLYL